MARFTSNSLWRWSGLWLVLFSGAFGCRSETSKAPPPPPPPADTYVVPVVSVKTTSPVIARANLNETINQAERTYAARPSQNTLGNVVALRLERARYYGIYEDFDRADELTKDVTRESTTTQRRLRAKVLARLHLFSDALALIDGIEATDEGEARRLLEQRATILAATGRAALARTEITAKNFATGSQSERFTAAIVEAALGNFEAADALYRALIEEHKTSSPYFPAATYFAMGVMWSERAGKPERGKKLYDAALERLSDFVVANVHAAEIEVEDGNAETVATKLAALETTDPEPQGLLSEIHAAAGRPTEAAAAKAKALEGYNGLLSKHRAAFADHAAEFFLGPGANPARAAELALENVVVRKSERAYSLAIRASEAAGNKTKACELFAEAKGRNPTGVELNEIELDCPGS